MIRRILISSTILAVVSVPALAQNTTTIIREAVPEKSQPIVANSPQDLALQEEIRRIRAYNAHVDNQVGISDTASTAGVINKYEGATVEIFTPPSTTISYASTPPQFVQTPIAQIRQAQNKPKPTAITTQRQKPTFTRIHRVVEDDTLYNLARRNCVSVEDIKNENALSGNNIRIGQALTLPANQCGGASAIAATSPMQIQTTTGSVRQIMPIQTGIKVRSGDAYAVLPKDSLYSIGKRYCLKADELATFNGIDTATPIQPGQILRLPASACD